MVVGLTVAGLEVVGLVVDGRIGVTADEGLTSITSSANLENEIIFHFTYHNNFLIRIIVKNLQRLYICYVILTTNLNKLNRDSFFLSLRIYKSSHVIISNYV